MSSERVFIALSGGVDSSVAALLLIRQGYRVVGVYMKNWSEVAHGEVETNGCAWEEEWASVREVGDRLGIETRVVNFEREYTERVVRYFTREYGMGRTPNPDIACNREIKFDVFARWSFKRGASWIATGHHVRSRRTRKGVTLLRGIDSRKDQSYFLYASSPSILARTLFPIGEYTKDDVRRIARENRLPSAERPDSQGICFVGPVRLGTFLKRSYRDRRGDVLDASGRRLSGHPGTWRYTIGQRHGLGVNRTPGPYYVSSIQAETNTIVVTGDERDLNARTITARDARWIGASPRFPFRATAKPRYRAADCAVMVTRQKDVLRVTFDEPQRALTPGQAVVFYRGEHVLGGATIEDVIDQGRYRSRKPVLHWMS